MKPIFDYSDYRLYIKDYYEYNKSRNSAFSYRFLSQKAGVNSSAFFKFLIEGKRNLNQKHMLAVKNTLKLEGAAAAYFENLVYFNQTDDMAQKDHYFERLITLQKSRNVTKIAPKDYEYFSKWYHCVIRELAVMIDFQNNYSHLAKALQPSVSVAEVKESVALLTELGFLQKDENGRYHQSEPVITTGESMRQHQIILFQIEMLKRAIESFARVNETERINSSTTMSISQSTYHEFIGKIRELRAFCLEKARADDTPNRVYQLTINLFPLSSRNKK